MGLAQCTHCTCAEDTEALFVDGGHYSSSASSAQLDLSMAHADYAHASASSSYSPRRLVLPIGMNIFQAGHMDSEAPLWPFGSDCLQASATALPWTKEWQKSCRICFTEVEEGKCLWQLCGNAQCRGFFCEACISMYVSTKVEEALHFVPMLWCPECRRRLCTSSWQPFAKATTLARHAANAAALLAVRCGACDETSSLLQSCEHTESDPEAREEALFGSLVQKGTENHTILRFVWRSFYAAESTGEHLLSVLIKIAKDGGLELENLTPGCAPTSLRKFLDGAAQLVIDVERRVALQLAVLKRFPKIRTPCCGQKMCFKCKVKGWHQGISCELRQQKFLSSDFAGIQQCPMCGVPIQKTEGCNEVRCVCTHTWTWSEKGGEVPGGIPLLCVAPSLPSSGIELLRSLLRHRADFNATGQTGWTVFHHAAAPQRKREAWYQDRSQCYPLRSDASRIRALLQIAAGTNELMDATDHDGDTSLSVAIAHGNLAGAKLLVASGAIIQPEVLSTLRSYTSPRAAAEAGAILRPNVSRLPPSPDQLWLFVQLGLPAQTKDALEAGGQVDKDVALAYMLLRVAHITNVGIPDASTSTKAVGRLLQDHASKHAVSWPVLHSVAATTLLKREVRSATDENREFDLVLLKALLQEDADPNATVELPSADSGKLWVPVVAVVAGGDPQMQKNSIGGALRMLLEASASANHADSENDSPLWWALLRPSTVAVEILLQHGASWPCVGVASQRSAHQLQDITDCVVLRKIVESVADVLPQKPTATTYPTDAPAIEKKINGDDTVPPWIRVLAPVYEPGTVDESAVAIILLLSSGGYTGWRMRMLDLRNDHLVAGSVKTWDALLSRASTALLLKEIRSSHEDDRSLNTELLGELLRHRADPNARQQSVCLFQEYWGQENYTPLMLLACSRNLPVTSARAAVRLLISFMADVDVVDEDGDNALAWAVMKQSSSMVEALVSAGACISQSLIDDFSYFAAISHPELLCRILTPIAPLVRVFLKDMSQPPLWAVVQFCSVDDIRDALGKESARVDAVVVEAFYRRQVQMAHTSTLNGSSRESSIYLSPVGETGRIKKHLQECLIVSGGETWDSFEKEAATRLLRSEVTGALQGKYELDMTFVNALLDQGADPNVQIQEGDSEEEEDDDEDDDDEGDTSHIEDSLSDAQDEVSSGSSYNDEG